ncbi:MAG: magnesium chelatase subunit H [Alphaproteobacteria bacterium]|nr:MAG: magnesium chelatase subunit H [Alphaproteobacteria bacterium]
MTPKAITHAETPPVRVVIVTLDNHLAGVVRRAEKALAAEIPGLSLTLHASTDWGDNRAALDKCIADIGRADIIIATMLFMEDQVQAVLPALEARRDACDAMICVMSAGEIIRLTKLGPFRMDGSQTGPMAWLKKLRGSKTNSSGAGQMAMLRRLPKILRYIPGKAQDLRAYFLTMQYWLSGSPENVADMVRFLIGRYAEGERRVLREQINAAPPRDYPEIGLYHPRAATKIVELIESLPPSTGKTGVVGVLVLRSYVLASDAGHYDGVIDALEARGLRVIPAFASGLDARPAIERYFIEDGAPVVDAVVSLTGFSLVGGPAYNDSAAAEEILARLDVPYISAQPLEFQSLERWGASTTGLSPVESTIMVAIPELDGATAPIVFGGRSDGSGEPCTGCARRCRFETQAVASRMCACPERAEMLAARVARLVSLRRSTARNRKIGIVLFNFPPNSGAVGSAAYLSVFASLHNTLKALKSGGYDVEVPATVEAVRTRLLEGNAKRYGADANVHTRIPADDHVRREPHLAEIEAQWGPAPGRQLSDGRSIFVLGAQFGNVFVGLQPGFGYEGDPMRLMFEASFAPTHAFSAFYRWLREDFGAHAVLHFGTHGALEFMPGKQVGLTGADWPDRLIGDLPNFYLYAGNNPTEGMIAKRRSSATLISHLTPPIAKSGLYQSLQDLKALISRWDTAARLERDTLAASIQDSAASLEMAPAAPAWTNESSAEVAALAVRVTEIEDALIPSGLHTIGVPPDAAERTDLLLAIAEGKGNAPPRAAIEAMVGGASPEAALGRAGKKSRALLEAMRELQATDALLARDTELEAILRALDARYIRPAPGGDLVRTPAVLPTGRNMHGFDPFRLPSALAVHDGALQANRLLTAHAKRSNGAYPESIAMVLWGSDNLKSEGGPIAQALALMGARPRFDGYGRLCGATLIPLAELKRPRIDVVMTLSGIFRDLLALQVRMLAEAAYLAAVADEPIEQNHIRKHALELQAAHGCDLETAALRVFSNADGAYGANVNQLIDSGVWSEEDELADAFESRKCFAYGRTGAAVRQSKMLRSILKGVDFTYQNLESVELGVTSIDHYVDTLGGISRAVQRARGVATPVYIGDETQGEGKVRTLSEQVSLETHTRTLNPRWYEGLLKHGYEGVRQIEAQVTNTMGWSATTGQVEPWVYQRISETYVLDDAMRRRLAALNPKASARMANRLLEAHERKYWRPDAATLDALRNASDELEDQLEGIAAPAA